MRDNRAAKWPFTGWIIVVGGILLVLGVANSTSWGIDDELPKAEPAPVVVQLLNPIQANTSVSECQQQAAPKCDGTFRVARDHSPAGILTGWIRTEGTQPGSHQHCTWIRLSGPNMTMENTLASGNVTEGPATVQITPSDYAFATYGCQPWQKVG